MGTPLGDFLRAKRDSVRPEALALAVGGRRRSPGLRRPDVAVRAGISVEYYTRIEQGQDRNPSHAVLGSVADALGLDAAERTHLLYLAKITGGACAGQRTPRPPDRTVRPTVLDTLRLLEPGAAYVTNRLGDVLAYTAGFARVTAGSGLLEGAEPNLTRYVFTDPRARTFFADWDQVADEQAFGLWRAPSAAVYEWFRAELAPAAGPEFTRRLEEPLPPRDAPLRIVPPPGLPAQWRRERMELPRTDAQELVTLLPADDAGAAG